MKALILVGFMVAFTACKGDSNPELEAAANAMTRSADACLLSVRDRHTKYEETPSCTALSALSMEFMRAEDEDDNKETPLRYQLMFAKAQTTAWIAVATSESGKSGLRI